MRRGSPREAFDPVYGARPLKRNIQKLVQDPLALKLLAGEIGEGSARHPRHSPRAGRRWSSGPSRPTAPAATAR